MLVVMIIALLAGSAIYFMRDNLSIAQKVRVDGDLKTIKTALATYEGLIGYLPTMEQGLKALTIQPQPKPRGWRKFTDKVLLDPYGNEYNYVQPGVHNPDGYDLFSAGKDRLTGTGDDLGNWDTE